MRLQKHAAFIPGLFVLAGLLYLLGPFVAAWLEIVAPFLARMLAFPVGRYALDVAFGLVALLYIAYLVTVLRSSRTRREKALAFLPLAILPLIWAAMSPLRQSVYGQEVESAYVAGGWTRMMLAGGPAAIRAEALDLLASPEQDALHTTIPDSEVPPSLRKLGDWVSVQRDYGLVLVGIKPVAAGGNEFGYMIQAGRTPLSIPWFFEYASNLRVWKIAEGIYFFEE